jgi:hypothetical protein
VVFRYLDQPKKSESPLRSWRKRWSAILPYCAIYDCDKSAEAKDHCIDVIEFFGLSEQHFKYICWLRHSGQNLAMQSR